MKLKIRNCVTDPEKKTLRSKGQGVFKPVLMGEVLLPGAIRMILAASMEKSDVDYLDFLVKNHSCSVLIVGDGLQEDCSAIYTYLGLEQESIEDEEDTADLQEEVEEVIEESEEVIEEPQSELPEEESIQEDAEEEEVEEEEPQPAYTDESLKGLKNSELREIAYSLVEDAPVSNYSKKKLIAYILEQQNV